MLNKTCPRCDEPMAKHEEVERDGETICTYCAQEEENDAAMEESYGAIDDGEE